MRITTYQSEIGLCLLKYSGNIYLGYIRLPQNEWTVSQYNTWKSSHTENLICLTDDYPPQYLSNYGLEIEACFDDILLMTVRRHNLPDNTNIQWSFKILLDGLLNKSSDEYHLTIMDKYITSLVEQYTQHNATQTTHR